MSKKISLFTSLVVVFALSACASTPGSDVANQLGPEDDPAGLFFASDLDCDMLTSESAQAECKTQVNNVIGRLIENEVVSHFDLERCKSLEDKIGMNCQMQLEDSPVKGPVSDSELQIFSAAMTGDLEVSEDGAPLSADPVFDTSACERLKTPGFREYCEERVQMQIDQSSFQEIISSGNVSDCDDLSGPLADQCLEFFNGPPDVETSEPDFTVPEAPPAPPTDTDRLNPTS